MAMCPAHLLSSHLVIRRRSRCLDRCFGAISRFLTLVRRNGVGSVRADRPDRTPFSLLVPALGAQLAGLAMGAATAAAIVGRTLVGWLMPVGADRRLVAAMSYAVQIVGSLVFILAAGTNVPLLLLGVMLFGAGIGNATSLPPLIAQVEFVKDDVPRVVALIVAIAPGVLCVRACCLRSDPGICSPRDCRGVWGRAILLCCCRACPSVGDWSISGWPAAVVRLPEMALLGHAKPSAETSARSEYFAF